MRRHEDGHDKKDFRVNSILWQKTAKDQTWLLVTFCLLHNSAACVGTSEQRGLVVHGSRINLLQQMIFEGFSRSIFISGRPPFAGPLLFEIMYMHLFKLHVH